MKHTGTDPDIPIIYEDEHLLVVMKPHNLLSQKDHTGDPDVQTLCREYLQHKYSKDGKIYLGLVHRLDRPVSGLMILAKTSRAADHISEQIRNNTMQKTYWAVVEGNPPQNGVYTHYLLKNRDQNIVDTVKPERAGAMEAVLSFEKIRETGNMSLLSIHLQTGRPHQIRVQLSAEGYPIWGDYKYGNPGQPDGRNIALQAVELRFIHPEQEEEIQLKFPPEYIDPWNRFDLDLDDID